ncbi:MAG: hypothetical protein AAC990_00245 [Dehalococcoides mccartyi]|uniref:hypothetical protein n=2 Tax=Dehalococcoides mccartyi TaxID=61435 RepID=UPI0030F9AEF4
MMRRMLDEIQGWLLKKSSLQLHVPHMAMYLGLEVKTADGEITEYRHQRSKSFVRNAYNLFFHTIAGYPMSDATWGDGYVNMKTTGGSLSSGPYRAFCFSTDSNGQGFLSPGSANDFGIIVGSGSDAESFESYALSSKIGVGNGSGQLYTLKSEDPVDSYTDHTQKRTLVRYFNNNSGATISLGEVGLVGRVITGGDTAIYALFSRDLITPPIDILDKAQLKVTYTISLVYPS